MQTNHDEKAAAARAARNAYMREYKRNMTEEQKEKRREYARQWRLNNKDRMKQHQENYWLRKAEEMKKQKGARS